jgi:hypothetical protein
MTRTGVKPLFQLGQVVMTAGVAAECAKDQAFADLIPKCLFRHQTGDWGNVCEEDKATNDDAAKHDQRILSAYTIDPSKGESQGWGENTLWVITEWDRSVTTFLFPDEY